MLNSSIPRRRLYFIRKIKNTQVETLPGIHHIKETYLDGPIGFVHSTEHQRRNLPMDIVDWDVPATPAKAVAYTEQEILSLEEDDPVLSGNYNIISGQMRLLQASVRKVDDGMIGHSDSYILSLSRSKRSDGLYSLKVARFDMETRQMPLDLTENGLKHLIRFTTQMKGFSYGVEINNVDITKLPEGVDGVVL